MQVPDHWDRQDKESEVGDDIAIPLNIDDVGRLDLTHCRRRQEELDIEGRSDRFASEDTEQHGDCRPNGQDAPDRPGSVAEFAVDVEDPVEEQQERDFGQRDADDVGVAGSNRRL